MVRLLLDNGANVNARTKHVSLHTSGLLACQDSPIASGATMHVQHYMHGSSLFGSFHITPQSADPQYALVLHTRLSAVSFGQT